MRNQKPTLFVIAVGLLAVVANGCKKDTINQTTDVTTVQQDNTPYVIDKGNFPAPKIAADNQLTIQGVLLGRMLFYEKTLSKNNAIACGSCHLQKFAFTDSAEFSVGVKGLKGKRHAMSVFNLAWHTNEFFWDGRAHLLRNQSLMPIEDTLEMFETLPSIVTKLSSNPAYKNQFIKTFGAEEINSAKISLALEQFMNSIVSNKSKYDNFLANTETLTASEDNGRKLFFAQYNPFFPSTSGADCAHCHGGFNFSNNEYMNNGLDTDASITDKGRENVTSDIADRAKFKVPSLRNIALTAPYMHDGRFKTLEEVVDHYNSGLKASTYIDPALENTRSAGLMLNNQQKIDLVNFLKTLTDNSLATNPNYASPF